VAWMRSPRTADSDPASSERGSAPAGSDTRIVVPRKVVPARRADSSAYARCRGSGLDDGDDRARSGSQAGGGTAGEHPPPSAIRTTRSQRSASAITWVVTITVVPSADSSPDERTEIAPLVGSSRKINCGARDVEIDVVDSGAGEVRKHAPPLGADTPADALATCLYTCGEARLAELAGLLGTGEGRSVSLRQQLASAAARSRSPSTSHTSTGTLQSPRSPCSGQ
jgi:hypothetical protein